MAIDNQTNLGRVQKILEILDLIRKSAVTNNATEEEIWKLLEPAMTQISEMVGAGEIEAPEPTENTPTISGGNTQFKPRWSDVYDMAQECSLTDLTRAMAVYLNRIDEEFHK